jgi:hypothetical protein
VFPTILDEFRRKAINRASAGSPTSTTIRQANACTFAGGANAFLGTTLYFEIDAHALKVKRLCGSSF